MTSAYTEAFPVGSRVRGASREKLETFRRTWKFHHKLGFWQTWLCAGRTYKVAEVFFYHGGDVLYRLRWAPGIWHEQRLNAVNQ